MSGTEQVAVVAAPFVGALLGGLFGYAKAKQADASISFKWPDFIVTWFTGLIAGGLFIGALNWAETGFSPGLVIAGLFAGAGFDYAAKKTVLP